MADLEQCTSKLYKQIFKDSGVELIFQLGVQPPVQTSIAER